MVHGVVWVGAWRGPGRAEGTQGFFTALAAGRWLIDVVSISMDRLGAIVGSITSVRGSYPLALLET